MQPLYMMEWDQQKRNTIEITISDDFDMWKCNRQWNNNDLSYVMHGSKWNFRLWQLVLPLIQKYGFIHKERLRFSSFGIWIDVELGYKNKKLREHYEAKSITYGENPYYHLASREWLYICRESFNRYWINETLAGKCNTYYYNKYNRRVAIYLSISIPEVLVSMCIAFL
jgi:hypothetical protein